MAAPVQRRGQTLWSQYEAFPSLDHHSHSGATISNSSHGGTGSLVTQGGAAGFPHRQPDTHIPSPFPPYRESPISTPLFPSSLTTNSVGRNTFPPLSDLAYHESLPAYAPGSSAVHFDVMDSTVD